MGQWVSRGWGAEVPWLNEVESNFVDYELQLEFRGSTMATIVGQVGASDTLVGTAANDIIDGHGGADFINGGGGTDVALFHSSSANFLVNTLSGITHVRALPGAPTEYYIPTTSAGGVAMNSFSDTVLINTEQLQFSDGFVNLASNVNQNLVVGTLGQSTQLNGTAGNDVIDARGGTETIDGGAGFDTVVFFDSKANFVVTTLSGVTHVRALATADPQYQHITDVILLNVEQVQFLDGVISNDTTPPTVTSFTPTSGASGVGVSNNISITFSEAVQLGIGLVTIRSGSPTGPVVEQFDVTSSSHVSVAGSVLTIDPTNNLSGATTYFVSVDSGAIKDLAGNAYAGESNYSFTTGAGSAPNGVGSPGITQIITGTANNDVIYSTSANDQIDGGAGVDTVIYAGLASQYSVVRSGGTISVTDTVAGRDGADILTSVEQVKFTDFTQIFDLTSSIDKSVYLLYQAALNRVPDTAGFRYWAGLADSQNMSASSLASQFITAPEFQQKYGGLDNAGYAAALYVNVIGRAPDAAGLSFWVNNLALGETRAQMLVDFATSMENLQATAAHTSYGFWTI